MIYSRRLRWIGFILLAMAFALAEPRKSYDGAWWISVSKSEQIGFVSGYIDCTDTELHGPDFLGAFITFRQRVSDYYQQNPGDLKAAVGDVLLRESTASEQAGSNGSNSKTQAPPGRPDVFSQPGYFNGEYWTQADGDERLGFLEGYLWCHENRQTTRTVRFSKPLSKYRNLVDAWYYDHPTDRRLNTPISTVLYRLRDRNSPPS